jgi:sarcosine oxidase delta subunit
MYEGQAILPQPVLVDHLEIDGWHEFILLTVEAQQWSAQQWRVQRGCQHNPVTRETTKAAPGTPETHRAPTPPCQGRFFMVRTWVGDRLLSLQETE